MVSPPRTKPCTFPYCEGRMILKLDERRTNQQTRQTTAAAADPLWFWECDRDDTHLERAKPEEL